MGPNSNTPKIERNPANRENGYNVYPNQFNVANQTTYNISNPSREMAPLHNEQLSSAELLAQPIQAMPAQTIARPVVPAKATTVASSVASDPTSAQDSDQIEREWVDQAKKIINTTKSDPYEQARQVSSIMRDYVKKRYGREVGKAPEV